MSVDYYFYSPESGKLLKSGRYAGMPFLVFGNRTIKNSDYGVFCFVKFDDEDNIVGWKITNENEIFPFYYDELLYYYKKEEILKMQKHMKCNNTLLQELLEKNNLDGLIVRIG